MRRSLFPPFFCGARGTRTWCRERGFSPEKHARSLDEPRGTGMAAATGSNPPEGAPHPMGKNIRAGGSLGAWGPGTAGVIQTERLGARRTPDWLRHTPDLPCRNSLAETIEFSKDRLVSFGCNLLGGLRFLSPKVTLGKAASHRPSRSLK